MQDRFTRGLIAGMLAGVAAVIVNFGAKSLNLSTLVWADFMGLYLLGKKPDSTGELIFFVIIQSFFLGGLGITFAFLLTLIKSQNYWLKGLTFGGTIWFISNFITFLFQLPRIKEIPLKTAISHLIGALIWGLLLSIILKWLDNRVKSE